MRMLAVKLGHRMKDPGKVLQPSAQLLLLILSLHRMDQRLLALHIKMRGQKDQQTCGRRSQFLPVRMLEDDDDQIKQHPAFHADLLRMKHQQPYGREQRKMRLTCPHHQEQHCSGSRRTKQRGRQ